MNKILVSILIAFVSFTTSASEQTVHPKKLIWPFEGVFGKFDRQAAQRGAQVYIEVCAACHGLYNLYYRNLKEIGFSEAEIKQIAQNYTVTDGPNDVGEMFERPATPSDRIKKPYPNETAARASNNGAYPPDLSLIIKARHDGANYLFSILTGYKEPPEDISLMPGLYYNPYFEGGQIAMPAPLMADMVTYGDGTSATIEQMSRDVVIFLQWAAEPEMEHRKSMGLKVIMFLTIFTAVFFVAKRKIWKKLKN
jgi:ubiquinol-cytochrome c reductase cytochrome c1 subunit